MKVSIIVPAFNEAKLLGLSLGKIEAATTAFARLGWESELILRGFTRDFEANGPSVARIARTTLLGWRRYRDDPDHRVRERYAWEARELATAFTAAVAAASRHFRRDQRLAARLGNLLAELKRRGYTDAELRKIAGLNLLGVLRRAEAVAAQLQKQAP
jgi:hypothetical protein